LFKNVKIGGPSATITWGYATPAVLRQWTVRKIVDDRTKTATWTLEAWIGHHVDRFALGRGVRDRQLPLLFTAPRKGGRWCWPIQTLQVGDVRVTATLGPPEH
jgi:hypothetical protein